MNQIKTAAAHFSSGKNCTQSVLLAFADELGLDEKQVFRLASGFGGGIAKNGHVCGAVSGAVMVMGMKYTGESLIPDEANSKTYERVNRFMEEFIKEKGSINCKDIIDGLELSTPEGRAEWKRRNLHDLICLPVVEKVVDILMRS